MVPSPKQSPDLPRVLALATISLAILMLAAWLSGDSDAIAPLTTSLPIPPLAAIGLLCAGASLLLLTLHRGRAWSIAPAAVSVAIGLLSSLSWAARWWPQAFPPLLSRLAQEMAGEIRVRPSIPGGVALTLLGLSLIWRSQAAEVRQRIADALALAAIGIGWISVIGGTLSTAVVSFVPRATMNLFAAGCVVTVAIGSIALRTDRGIAAVFSSPYYGGRLVRFLVPVALVVPVLSAVVAGGVLPDGHLPKGRAATMFAVYCVTLAGVAMYLGHRCSMYEHQLRSAERERERVIADLQRSLQDVCALEREMVRMCAWTQTIEDEGRWISFEEFLRDRLHVQVEPAISPAGIKLLKGKQVTLAKAGINAQR